MKLSTLLILMCVTISMIPIGIIWAINGFESTSFLLIAIIIAVTFVISVFISYFITKPLVKLTNTIDAISKGKLDIALEHSEIYEIDNLINSLDRIMASLKLAIVKVGVKKDEIFEEKRFAEGEPEDLRESDLENEINSIVLIDKNAKIIDCNENICKMLGYSKEEMLEKNIVDIDVIESKESIANRISTAKEKGKVSFKTLHRRKDGRPILVDGYIRYIEDEDRFECIFKEEGVII